MITIALAALLSTSAQNPSALKTEDCNFGEVYAFSSAHCSATITNRSTTPIKIQRIVASYPGDRYTLNKTSLKPGESATLALDLDIGNAAGKTGHRFDIHLEDGQSRSASLAARGFVMSIFDNPASLIDLKDVNVGAHASGGVFHFTSSEFPTFRIAGIRSKPTYITAKISDDGQSVEVGLTKDAPWRAIEDTVALDIDSPHQRTAWITIKANAHGVVAPSSNPAWLGVLPPSPEEQQLVKLTELAGHSLRVDKMDMKGILGSLHVYECEEASPSCKVVKVKVSPTQPPGMLRGTAILTFPHLEKGLEVSILGFKTPARAPTSASEQQESETPTRDTASSSAAKREAADHSNAEISPGGFVAPPAVPGEGPLLKWAVQNEETVYGYQIYRADAESGPFRIINEKTILARQSTDKSTSQYQWRDTTAKKGETYWYYIGLIHTDAKKERLSQPQKKIVQP